MDSRLVLEMTAPGATGCTPPERRKPPPEHGLSTSRGTRIRRLGSWKRAITPESILIHQDKQPARAKSFAHATHLVVSEHGNGRVRRIGPRISPDCTSILSPLHERYR